MRPLFLATILGLAVQPAGAATREETEALAAALGLPQIIEVMRAEGLDYGAGMEDQMFPGKGGPAWRASVDTIYDPAMMQATVVNAMVDGLAETEIGDLLAFFSSERGREIIAYEVSARAALMDSDIEEAARQRFLEIRAEDPDALGLIERFVEVNDLVDSNVMGAMNSNYAFYQGLMAGGAFDGSLTDSDVVADVWAQEDEIRSETDLWVHSYLAMAYQPLADADLEAYIAISETPAGQALNRALFEGFDEMYVAISRALGVSAAGFMAGEDI